jgi:hypothetical protein
MLLWIYCIFDVIASEESLIRNLPKTMWLVIVIFVPTIGQSGTRHGPWRREARGRGGCWPGSRT